MPAKHANRQLRIIGGQWRGRKLTFPDHPQLRPTPDRVRETVFNWLQDAIPGARCLDLFAGSGALGFEAASRGASEVQFVEFDPLVARYLEQQAAELGAASAAVTHADARVWLQSGVQPFDVIFLDPPFGKDDLGVCCELIEVHAVLSAHGRVYLENDAADGVPLLPSSWEVVRSKKAGQVGYHLAAVRA